MAKLYKLLLALASFAFISFSLTAQSSASQNLRDASIRFKRDFEIKGIAQPDNALLKKIDIGRYDYLRQPDKRVEAKDSDNNLILVLYSENEIAAMKQEHLRRAPDAKTVTDVKYIPTPKTER